MQVVILCGGIGTRLKEETEFRPKPMVKIGDHPVLWHIMKTYSHYGCDEFVLALGYKGEMIKNYFFHYELMNNDFTIELGKPENVLIHQGCSEVGWRITLADTGKNTLKGARLKRIEHYIRDDVFMVTYGDGLADVNIGNLVEFHRSHGKLATVTGVNPVSRFGELSIEGDRVRCFREKPDNKESLVNGGYFVFDKKVFQYLSQNENCDLEIGPLETIARDGQLMVYKHEGFWACMDTIRDMEYLNKLWNEGNASWKVW